MSTTDDLTTRPKAAPLGKQLVAFLVLLAISLIGVVISNSAARGFGKIQVETISFMTKQNVPMVAKLYRPVWVTEKNPAPGILALHGYQSDKEATTTFGTIELARRGFVVLSIDQFGQGYSTEYPVSPKIMSGAQNGIDYLKTLPIVQKDNLGAFGHSTGSIFAVSLALANPEINAVVALSGEGGNPDILKLKNYMLVQGDAEEIGGYREKTFPVSSLVHNKKRLEAFGLKDTDTLQWNHLYGSFADGSARKAALVSGTHLGVMVSPQSNTEVVSWFNDALRKGQTDEHWINPTNHVYQWKEIGGAIALLAIVASIVPLAGLLLRLPIFDKVIGGPTKIPAASKRGLAIMAVVNILFTIVLYPVFTAHGGGADPISKAVPFLPLQMGNGICGWLVATMVVTLISYLIWRKSGAGKGVSKADLGITQANGTKIWVVQSLVFALALIAWVAFVVSTVAFFRGPEFRVLWPMLKMLTAERAAIFLPYFLIIWAFFFLVNGLSLHLTANIAAKEGESEVKLWARRSGYGMLSAIGGLAVLWLFHFVPDFMGYGPGMDIIGLPKYGGRWMMMLAVIIPQFVVLVMLNTWLQIRTRSIWVASFVGAALFAWIMVGGQVGAF